MGGSAIPSGFGQSHQEHTLTSAKVQKSRQSDNSQSCVGDGGVLG